jgi:hypothetical protein
MRRESTRRGKQAPRSVPARRSVYGRSVDNDSARQRSAITFSELPLRRESASRLGGPGQVQHGGRRPLGGPQAEAKSSRPLRASRGRAMSRPTDAHARASMEPTGILRCGVRRFASPRDGTRDHPDFDRCRTTPNRNRARTCSSRPIYRRRRWPATDAPSRVRCLRLSG